jgi:hypothetical protein
MERSVDLVVAGVALQLERCVHDAVRFGKTFLQRLTKLLRVV